MKCNNCWRSPADDISCEECGDEVTMRTIDEAITDYFGMDLSLAWKHGGPEGVTMALRANMVQTAEEILRREQAGDDTRHDADLLAHLVLSYAGFGDQSSRFEKKRE